MNLKRLSVTNFGCLRDVTIDLGSLTVLVGPNNAGKSMILRAIEQLSFASVAPQGWATVYSDADTFSASTFNGRGKKQTFEIEGSIGETACRYQVTVGKRHYAGAEILAETLDFQDADSGKRQIFRDPQNNGLGKIVVDEKEQEIILQAGGAVPLLSSRASLAFHQAPLAPELKDVFDRFPMSPTVARLRRFALSPGQLRKPVPVGAVLPDPPQIRADGWGLAGAIANLLLGDRDTADSIEKALQTGLSGVRRLKVDRRTTRLFEDTENPIEPSMAYDLALETSQGSTVSSTYISDGVLLYMAYLVLTMGPSSQSIIMLEEPETGIHPGLLVKLVSLLRGLSQGSSSKSQVQVIVTTHSPLLLNLVTPAEIRIVARGPDGGTIVTPFENADDLQRLLEFQGPGEIWANLGEEYILRGHRSAG